MDRDFPRVPCGAESMIERTLVLFKPDAVQRQVVGELITRFERVGLKIAAMKMAHPSVEIAREHYADVAKRRGELILNLNVEFMTSGPIIAVVLEGLHAVELVRKMVGSTEPKSSAPGTIRGDYAHHSYAYADEQKTPIRNLVHASSDSNDAKREIALWFRPEELCSYKTVHEKHTL